MSTTKETAIYCYSPGIVATERRTGIQRVAFHLYDSLKDLAPAYLVKWDDCNNQLRLFGKRDLGRFYRGGEIPERARLSPFCQREHYRFGDLIDRNASNWLILPEISYHVPNGHPNVSKAVSLARDYGMKVASVFYDLIPVRNADYSAYADDHARYVAELARNDLIVAISRYSAVDLNAYFASHLGSAWRGTAECPPVVRTVSLPEGAPRFRPDQPASSGDKIRIVMLGTVEPRKQQVRVVRLLRSLVDGRREGKVELDIFGSLHRAVRVAFMGAIKDAPYIKYHGYADDSSITECLHRATFSIFASVDEGYGLPIVESVAHGVPCITADFGSMKEAAAAGGCLMVDVRDDQALSTAIERLLDDGALLERLRAEARARTFRGWDDYAREILCLLTEVAESSAGVTSPAVRSPGEQSGVHFTAEKRGCITVHILSGDLPAGGRDTVKGIVFDPDCLHDQLDCEATRSALRQEISVWGFRAYEHHDALLSSLGGFKEECLLPGRIVIEENPEQLTRRVLSQMISLHNARKRRHRIAYQESLYGSLRKSTASRMKSQARLEIVISTYNRAPFLDLNVPWLLRQLEPHRGLASLRVVNNASTDETARVLSRYQGHPLLKVQTNPHNVGMLGNLRVASGAIEAEYGWITGDDDFIEPGAIGRVLDLIRSENGVPMIVGNFSIYMREKVLRADSPQGYILEKRVMGKGSLASGRHRIREIAVQHDNLFTAVYPLVFRSDLAVTCFDSPFDGIPFSTLLESAPTTQFILNTLGETEAYWINESVIVGNAHNSWSSHRFRWCGVILPLAYDLAAEAEVDRRIISSWKTPISRCALDSLSMIRNGKAGVYFDDAHDLRVLLRHFDVGDVDCTGFERLRFYRSREDLHDITVWTPRP